MPNQVIVKIHSVFCHQKDIYILELNNIQKVNIDDVIFTSLMPQTKQIGILSNAPMVVKTIDFELVPQSKSF